MTMHCPTCGHETSQRAPIEGLSSAPISGAVRRAIIEVLVDAYPGHVETQRLIDIVYADDPDGGPTSAQSTISKHIMKVRAKIEEYGWTIPFATRGPGSSGYCLAPIETIAKIRNGGKA